MRRMETHIARAVQYNYYSGAMKKRRSYVQPDGLSRDHTCNPVKAWDAVAKRMGSDLGLEVPLNQ